ncbi:LOW QUALITY PROTEIN: hypothetical protein RJ639_042934 [Escallonia herrerae]|uniref:Uncharacterized protein n=1 Tax=Escallonia herrerae TaxID=1293975 RepID=A0AA88WCW6_9ASTE|nr:LOW QUALITY PROTEIN: hypothetical protein RJ639_042934 [Escallonia herrerae]
MATISKNKKDESPAYTQTVQEIMKLYKSLAPRPAIEEAEAALSVMKSVSTEEQIRLEEISNRVAPQDVPTELLSVLQQVQKAKVAFQSHDKRKDATHLIQLDKIIKHLMSSFRELLRSFLEDQIESNSESPVGEIESKVVIEKRERGEEKVESLKGLVRSFSTKAIIFSSGEESAEKLSLLKVAALIENTDKTGAGFLDLHGKLMDTVEWLPLSLGKLSNIFELILSANNIMALPCTIGSLRELRKLDVHANQLINLPASFSELHNLTDLDLHANRLKSLPASFGNLTNLINLDLGSNQFAKLPYNIGIELRLDFNQLKGLPEAVGKLKCLKILTLHYNRIKKLPTTMGILGRLKELNISFNEVESIPESLCFAVSLVKLNVGKNCADLRTLPRSIGNLENLEELDISDDQIRTLPDSFRFLSKLKIFRADETPLELPPRQVTKLGAQAVVDYMADFVAKEYVKAQQPKKKKGFWSRVCPLFYH